MAKPIKPNKFLFGDDTANTLNGTNDGESIFGLAANDTLSAWGGSDDVSGGNGNDIVNGGKGNDRLFGEAGNDTLVGEDGNDVLLGGDGDDVLLGGRGVDVFDGGAGSDKFLISRGDGVDTIRNFASTDRIDLGAFHFDSAQAVLDAFNQVGHNAVLDLGPGDQLILQNIKVSDLSASQFNVSPYLVPTNTSISVTSLLTAGDHVGDYTMAGIPDGLGAFDNGDGTFTVLMNHEIGTTLGAVRAHGATGAFVSEWVFDKTTLEVKSGHDLIQHVFTYNVATSSYVDHSAALGNGIAFNRFCSADLADQSAFYNAETGLGYNGGRLFLNGEESGAEGRAFAHIASGAEAGKSYELAWLGNMAYENVVANAHTGDKTVVAVTDDGENGQVYFYAGEKKATGSAIDMAGLTGGHLFGIHVTEFEGAANNAPDSTSPLGADNSSAFTMIDLGDVSGKTGSVIDGIDKASEDAGVTSFLRPEDGAWDTLNHNRFYFVTTNAIDKPTQLWAADFIDASNPALGGTIKLLVNGDENGTDHPMMFDNITVNAQGKVVLCEDVGNNVHLGKVWQYDPATDALSELAQHDASRFLTGGANFLTQDEEASGVIDVSHILGNAGENVYLIDTQAHFATGGELFEGGQLQLIHQYLV